MPEETKVSKAQQKAVNKYVKNNYDRVNVTFPKGRKIEIKEHAAAQGESVNAFINRAINETMERDISPTAASSIDSNSDKSQQRTADLQAAGNHPESGWVLSPKTGKALLIPENISKVDFGHIKEVRYQGELVDIFGSDGFTELYRLAAEKQHVKKSL